MKHLYETIFDTTANPDEFAAAEIGKFFRWTRWRVQDDDFIVTKFGTYEHITAEMMDELKRLRIKNIINESEQSLPMDICRDYDFAGINIISKSNSTPTSGQVSIWSSSTLSNLHIEASHVFVRPWKRARTTLDGCVFKCNSAKFGDDIDFKVLPPKIYNCVLDIDEIYIVSPGDKLGDDLDESILPYPLKLLKSASVLELNVDNAYIQLARQANNHYFHKLDKPIGPWKYAIINRTII